MIRSKQPVFQETLDKAHLSIPLEIWVESVPLRGKMRYNVEARLSVPLNWVNVQGAQQ